jgi:hypothetical protein
MIGAEYRPEFGAEEFPRCEQAVVCRHRGGKRIGLMLETSDKDVHEKLPVSRSPTIEGCQSSFAESAAHIPGMEKI